MKQYKNRFISNEVQRKNAEKLQKKFDEDNVPEFIRRYFINIKSKEAARNNLIRKFPSDEQLKLMEEKIKNKRDKYVSVKNLCILRVLKGSALRESELAGLDISDLFLDEQSNRLIGENMPCAKIIGKGKYRERESRIVYLTGDAVKAISEWMEIRDALDNIIDKDAVFLKKMEKGSIKIIYRKCLKNMVAVLLRI